MHTPPKAEGEAARKKHRLRVLVDPDVLKNVRRVELFSLLSSSGRSTIVNYFTSPHLWYHPPDGPFRSLTSKIGRRDWLTVPFRIIHGCCGWKTKKHLLESSYSSCNTVGVLGEHEG